MPYCFGSRTLILMRLPGSPPASSEARGPAAAVAKTPAASSEAVARNMRANRSKDTGPERALRRELHARGLRFRIPRPPSTEVRSTADIVFPRARLAVYVDGCFWHRCPQHAVEPKRNREFWIAKLRGNVERDRRTEVELELRGWTVLRVWEHEDPKMAADIVEATLRRITAVHGA